MIKLREATDGNLELMLHWRNNPEVWQGFYTQSRENRPLSWAEHYEWWLSRNKSWRTFIVEYFDEYEEGRSVGVVTIGQLDHWSPEVGFYIGEISLWGKGIGKQAVEHGLNIIRQYGKNYCHTTILDNNKRSIRLVKSLGFRYLGQARKGESWYQLELS